MGIEIERKFLVVNNDWKVDAIGSYLKQGYISSTPGRIVRVRIEGDAATLTIKGLSIGITCGEWNYPIPLSEAQELLDTVCQQPLIEKYRYRLPMDGLTWEIDAFLGANAGLVVAEIELPSDDVEFNHPHWLGEDVSHDRRYANANLLTHPFKDW
ncbi:CYTH domain-containing protein [Undibacterium sp. RuRC25W]|uniref:CYTH domain-containing protein n=1 Tax=Undibacterium sp. RuRC25W TaxID=3413047 RepID=UPI003BF06DF1